MNGSNSYPLACDTWDGAELNALDRVIRSRQFSMGAEVAAFEREAAQWFGARYCVMVNSGSSANLLAIAGLVYHPAQLLRPGDEVIVPTVSWSTTYYPLHQNNLSMRYVDVDPDTLNLDLGQLEAALTPRTRAVLAVNLLGNPLDLPWLAQFCEDRGLLLIEDNCESMGATVGGRQAGTWGICGTFSTFFSHHISTMEGGFLLTDDTQLYHVLLSLRAHGWLRGQPKDSHLRFPLDSFMEQFRFVLPGFNVRPLEMSGATGREQLKKLRGFVDVRRANASLYLENCRDIEGIRLQRETGMSSWFGFSFVLEGRLAGLRPKLVGSLKSNGIDCRPIVTGNFLRNPVITHLDHSVSGPTPVADEVDTDGLFVGNHHYPLHEGIAHLASTLRHFARQH